MTVKSENLNNLNHWELREIAKSDSDLAESALTLLNEREISLDSADDIIISHFAINTASCYLAHLFINTNNSVHENDKVGLVTWLQSFVTDIIEENQKYIDEVRKAKSNYFICKKNGLYWHLSHSPKSGWLLIAITTEETELREAPEMSTSNLVLSAHVINRLTVRMFKPLGYMENGGLIPWLLAKVFTNKVIEDAIKRNSQYIDYKQYRFITHVDKFKRLRVITLIKSNNFNSKHKG